MALYKNKYRVESARIQNWDYGWNGKYFITIVTRNREHYFGRINSNKKMILSEIGKIAEKYWFEIPTHFSFAILDAFIVMPNHVHGIIIINKKRIDNNINDDLMDDTTHGCDHNRDRDLDRCCRDKACLVSTINTTIPHHPSTPATQSNDCLSPGQKRFRNPGKNNISSIIGSYKSVVSRISHKINHDFNWHSRFHDHIICNDNEFYRIRNYIINNQKNWMDDKFYK